MYLGWLFFLNKIFCYLSKKKKKKNANASSMSFCCVCSVDQFFECIDGMRNSQSALASSGMWNWTCSVFSAITAASSLASGSLLIPSGICSSPHFITGWTVWDQFNFMQL